MRVEYKEILTDKEKLLSRNGNNVAMLCKAKESYLEFIALQSSEFHVVKESKPSYRKPLSIEAHKIFSEFDLECSNYIDLTTKKLRPCKDLDIISILYIPQLTERIYDSLKDVMDKGIEKNFFTLIVTDNICVPANKLNMEIQLCKKWKA